MSLAHGIKGSSSLIYACRINLPLFSSLRPLLSVSFSRDPLLVAPSDLVAFSIAAAGAPGARKPGRNAKPGGGGQATPIMRGARVILCKYFPRRVFAQARPAFGREYASFDGSSLNYNQSIRDHPSGGFPSERGIRQTEPRFVLFFLFFFIFSVDELGPRGTYRFDDDYLFNLFNFNVLKK